MASKVAVAVSALADPICQGLGYELVDVTFTKEGSKQMLRFFIDKPGGVTLEDCEQFSRRIDPVLDAADPVPGSYYLEVSSPGLDRPLKSEADFVRFAGSQVRIRTFAAIEGSRNLQGTLMGISDGKVLLMQENTQITLPLDQVSKANIVPEF